jgi:hypothetical protein
MALKEYKRALAQEKSTLFRWPKQQLLDLE